MNDANRYKALSAWIRSGQPAGAGDLMARAMLALAERRKVWPIPQADFDSAIDKAIEAMRGITT